MPPLTTTLLFALATLLSVPALASSDGAIKRDNVDDELLNLITTGREKHAYLSVEMAPQSDEAGNSVLVDRILEVDSHMHPPNLHTPPPLFQHLEKAPSLRDMIPSVGFEFSQPYPHWPASLHTLHNPSGRHHSHSSGYLVMGDPDSARDAQFEVKNVNTGEVFAISTASNFPETIVSSMSISRVGEKGEEGHDYDL